MSKHMYFMAVLSTAAILFIGYKIISTASMQVKRVTKAFNEEVTKSEDRLQSIESLNRLVEARGKEISRLQDYISAYVPDRQIERLFNEIKRSNEFRYRSVYQGFNAPIVSLTVRGATEGEEWLVERHAKDRIELASPEFLFPDSRSVLIRFHPVGFMTYKEAKEIGLSRCLYFSY